MTEVLITRARNAALAGGITAMTCEVDVIDGPLRRPVATAPALCRPTGRSPESHRRAVRTPLATSVSPMYSSDVRVDRVLVEQPRSNAGAPAAATFAKRRRIAGIAAGLLVGLGLALGLTVMGIIGSDYERAATAAPAATQVVHVRSGESLTSLAGRIAPEQSAAAVIATVRELNDLSTSALRPGQALVVPAYR